MKKCFLLLVVFGWTLIGHAQFVVTGTGRALVLTGNNIAGLQALCLINGITADNQLVYNGHADSYLWTTFDGSFVSNQPSIAVDDETGYILNANGQKYYVWVIDYHRYPVQLTSIAPTLTNTDACSQLSLQVSANVPPLLYRDSLGSAHSLPRLFTLTYNNALFSNNAWNSITQTQVVNDLVHPVITPAPYCNTSFTISGDQYAASFGMATPSVTSPVYQAVRVEAHLTGTINERTALNEAGREIGPLEGSAPLDVDFQSNANVPVTQFYEWFVYNNQVPGSYYRYTDQNLHYVFSQAGSYKVVLTVSNATSSCSYSDSLTVKVSDSFIDVPNVFTPNGDGINDEFRVSYRSIVQFHMTVYSSWAGKVFETDDPGRGWDGRSSGRLEPPGVYYYLINATGADGKKYKLKGSVTLLRDKDNH
ncbi:MAG: gliding motility-associated C-terminal domain-containing protein [Microbacter sp.]